MQTANNILPLTEANLNSARHAINNQLSVLHGYLQLIVHSPKNGDQVAKWSQKAFAAYERLALLVDQLEVPSAEQS